MLPEQMARWFVHFVSRGYFQVLGLDLPSAL
jgi:hypothetical protein